MTKEEIAKILKQLRIKAGLTQMQAAAKINRKQQTLASWETGQSQPDANTLFVLCAMYGVSVDEAFGFKVRQTPQISYQYDFSPEAAEVAEAYDKADFKSKNSARYALDLPLLEPALDKKNDLCVNPPQVNTLMVAARGGGVFEVPIDHPFTDEDEKELDEIAARSMEENKDL